MEPKLYIQKSNDVECGFDYFYGYSQNEKLFDKTYEFAKPFINGLAFVYSNEKWDIIDQLGQGIIERTKKKGHLNEILVLPILNSISPLSNIYFKNYIFQDNLIACVNPKVLFELLKKRFLKKFDFIENYMHLESVIVVYKYRNKFTRSGTDLLILENISCPCDKGELIGIKEVGKKWGFITMVDFNRLDINNYVIKPLFEYVAPFSQGLAKVKVKERFGFINVKGETVIDFMFDDARSFRGDFAPVAIANHRGNSMQKSISFAHRYSDKRWNYLSKTGTINHEYGNGYTRLSAVEDIHQGFFGIVNDENEMIQRVVGICEDNFENLKNFYQRSEFFSKISISNKLAGTFENVYRNILKVTSYLEQLSPMFNIKRNMMGPESLQIHVPEFTRDQIKHCVFGIIEENPLSVDSLLFDFDMTQEEMDILLGINSVEIVYGDTYLLYKNSVDKRKKEAQESREWDSKIESEKMYKNWRNEMNDEQPGWEWNID